MSATDLLGLQPAAATAAQTAPEARHLRRQLLALAGALIGLSGLLVVVLLVQQRTQALESGQHLNESLARVVEAQASSAVQAVDQHLRLTAQGLALLAAAGNLNEISARALLRELVAALPFVRSIWVLDAQGRVVHAPEASAVGLQLADRDYFQVYQSNPQTNFYIGSPIRSRPSGRWLISAARPLRNADGAFAGVVVTGLDPPYFDRLWNALDLGPDGVVALLRHDGVLMMRSPFSEASMGQKLFIPDLQGPAPNARTSGHYNGPSPVDGRRRLTAYRALAGQPELLVLVARSADTVLAGWRQQALLVAAVWTVAATVIGLLFAALDRAWRQRLQAAAQARQMAERLTLATDAAAIGVWDWDVQRDVWQASATYYTMLGWTADAGPGDRRRNLQAVHADDRADVMARIQAVLDGTDAPYAYDARMRHADGSLRWVHVAGRVLARDAAGKPTRLLGVRTDITERQQTEAALRRSLADQGALLKEVHHRVKNNLQIIHSLLRLEAGRSLLPETAIVLRDMRGRIQSMALLHESLYRTGSFAETDLGAYLRQVATQAFRALSPAHGAVKLQLDLVSARLELEQALPCGLLVNELISNSLKHGFPNGRRGEVRVTLQVLDGDADLQLCVSDTGVGLPSDFAARQGQSLGLQLVSDLAQQLQGQLDMGPAPQAVFTLTFRPSRPVAGVDDSRAIPLSSP